jgi:hypothetical protein
MLVPPIIYVYPGPEHCLGRCRYGGQRGSAPGRRPEIDEAHGLDMLAVSHHRREHEATSTDNLTLLPFGLDEFVDVRARRRRGRRAVPGLRGVVVAYQGPAAGADQGPSGMGPGGAAVLAQAPAATEDLFGAPVASWYADYNELDMEHPSIRG